MARSAVVARPIEKNEKNESDPENMENGSCRVLVAGADLSLAFLLADRLILHGFYATVSTAVRNLDQVLDIQKPDAVLLDLDSGSEAAFRALAAIDRCGIHAVLFSSEPVEVWNGHINPDKCVFFRKPFEAERVLNHLDSLKDQP